MQGQEREEGSGKNLQEGSREMQEMALASGMGRLGPKGVSDELPS